VAAGRGRQQRDSQADGTAGLALLAGARSASATGSRLAAQPHLILHALSGKLGERGVVVSCDTFWRFLEHQGISFKKTVFATEQIVPTSHAPPRLRETATPSPDLNSIEQVFAKAQNPASQGERNAPSRPMNAQTTYETQDVLLSKSERLLHARPPLWQTTHGERKSGLRHY
jgi:hypothetical protein